MKYETRAGTNVFVSFPFCFLLFYLSFRKLFHWFPFFHKDYSSINDILHLHDREKLFQLIDRTFSRWETKIKTEKGEREREIFTNRMVVDPIFCFLMPSISDVCFGDWKEKAKITKRVWCMAKTNKSSKLDTGCSS